VGAAVGTLAAGGGPRFRTLAIAELRAPATSLLLYLSAMATRSRYPLALTGDGVNFGVLGGRGYFAVDSDGLRFYGWDAEFLDVVLGDSGQVTAAARTGFLDNELRMRIGVRSRDPSVHLPSMFGGAWVTSIEVNSGFFSSLFK
jgi:hypothetical protein